MSDGEATQQAQEDVKPDVKPDAEHLNLKVKAQVGSVMRGRGEKPLVLTSIQASTACRGLLHAHLS